MVAFRQLMHATVNCCLFTYYEVSVFESEKSNWMEADFQQRFVWTSKKVVNIPARKTIFVQQSTYSQEAQFTEPFLSTKGSRKVKQIPAYCGYSFFVVKLSFRCFMKILIDTLNAPTDNGDCLNRLDIHSLGFFYNICEDITIKFRVMITIDEVKYKLR